MSWHARQVCFFTQSWKKIDTLRQISSRGAARPAYPVQSFIGWRGCRKSERNFPPILSCCSSSTSGRGFFSFVLTAGVSFLLSLVSFARKRRREEAEFLDHWTETGTFYSSRSIEANAETNLLFVYSLRLILHGRTEEGTLLENVE